VIVRRSARGAAAARAASAAAINVKYEMRSTAPDLCTSGRAIGKNREDFSRRLRRFHNALKNKRILFAHC
jgi:hypothetical protein